MYEKTDLFCPICGAKAIIKTARAHVKYGNDEPEKCPHEFCGHLYTCTECNESFVKEQD